MNLNTTIENFKVEIHDIYKSYRFSHIGLLHLKTEFYRFKNSNNLENFRIEDQELDVNLHFNETEIQKASEYGFYQRIIAGNTIAMFYNLWEDNYRTLIASQKNLNKKEDLKSDFFGDLGKIRNAIVHNHYQRTSDIDKLTVLRHIFPDIIFHLTTYEVHSIYLYALQVLDSMKQPE